MTNVPGNTSYFSFQLLSEVLLVKAQFPSRLARADTGVISEYCAAITHCTKSKSWLSILSRFTGGPWNPEAWRLIIRNNWLPPQGAPPSPSSFLLLDPEKDKTHILTHTHTHSLTYTHTVLKFPQETLQEQRVAISEHVMTCLKVHQLPPYKKKKNLAMSLK